MDSHFFHPQRNIFYIRNIAIKALNPEEKRISDAKLYLRFSINGNIQRESHPLDCVGDHWNVEFGALVPRSVPLCVFTIMRQQDPPLEAVELGSAYFSPEEYTQRDEEVQLDVLSDDPDMPALELHLHLLSGGELQANGSDPYADLHSPEFLVLLGHLQRLIPSQNVPESLLPDDIFALLRAKCYRLESKFRYQSLIMLADIRLRKYQATCLGEDRERAHDIYEEAVRSLSINDSLSEAEREIWNLDDNHFRKQIMAGVFGEHYYQLYRKTSNMSHLRRAVALGEEALRLHPTLHLQLLQTTLLHVLFVYYLDLFECGGKMKDLDHAITLASELGDLPDPSPAEMRIQLNDLASGLSMRFMYLRIPVDGERTIQAYEKLIEITDIDHPSLPGYLNNLAMALLFRYNTFGTQDALERSILSWETAIRVSPDTHPDKPTWLRGLCNSLLARYELLWQREDLARAIEVAEAILVVTPSDSYIRPAMLETLANALRCRYDADDDPDDLDRAVQLLSECTVSEAPDRVDAGTVQFRLGETVLTRFRRTRDVGDLTFAIELFSEVAASARAPRNRLAGAARWGETINELNSIDKAMAGVQYTQFLDTAMEIYPQLSWLGVPVANRHGELQWGQEVTKTLFHRVVRQERYMTALEWFEQGRSVVWSQLLQLRFSLDDLRAVDPLLADRIGRLSKELQSSSLQAGVTGTAAQTSTGDAPSTDYRTIEMGGMRHRELVDQWTDAVEKAQALPGLDRFLKPKTALELTSLVRDHPLIIISVADQQSDALIIFPGNEGMHIDIPEFTLDDANRLRAQLVLAISGDYAIRSQKNRGGGMAPFEDEDSQTSEELFAGILSELWYKIVQRIILGLDKQYGVGVPPPGGRVHWCPSGPLAFLPLHAAGDYSKTEPGHKISDCLVSSYTPTIGSLEAPTIRRDADDFSVLTVAVSSPDGQMPIPGTHDEVQTIAAQLSKAGRAASIRQLIESTATSAGVLEEMKKCNWVHFACHGVQDESDPTASALLLAGTSRLRLSDIVETSLDSAELAFLSACQTAAGAERLPEESVHLAAGLLIAGYKGVVATMWSIMDRDAPRVSEDVYKYMLRDPTKRPDYRDAAHALHLAVANLRERRGERAFLSWVPFVHYGL